MKLCKGCYVLAMKAGNMETIRRLVESGKFFCVYGKHECGKKDGSK
jgi:hypothetical protein